MRRLRTLLSAGRRPRGAGAKPPDGPVVHSGRVGRRGLLGLIAAAPVTLPAAVRAAAAPPPLLMGSVVSFDGDGAYAASLARYHAELDAYADSVERWAGAAGAPAVSPASPARLGRDPEAVARDVERFRADTAARGLWAPAFIDDVGGGP